MQKISATCNKKCERLCFLLCNNVRVQASFRFFSCPCMNVRCVLCSFPNLWSTLEKKRGGCSLMTSLGFSTPSCSRSAKLGRTWRTCSDARKKRSGGHGWRPWWDMNNTPGYIFSLVLYDEDDDDDMLYLQTHGPQFIKKQTIKTTLQNNPFLSGDTSVYKVQLCNILVSIKMIPLSDFLSRQINVFIQFIKTAFTVLTPADKQITCFDPSGHLSSSLQATYSLWRLFFFFLLNSTISVPCTVRYNII